MTPIARHHVVEYRGCSPEVLDRAGRIEAALRRLCRGLGFTPMESLRHAFTPHGLTVVVVLRESHLAYSSWPEYGYATITLELCGGAPGLPGALKSFGRELGARSTRLRSLKLYA